MAVVSVIMPIFNAVTCVHAAIDAVIAQTYPQVELIVVDDGSQDDTVAVVRQKLKRDFKAAWQIIELGVNRGPSAARNVGLRAASGDWVQFLDSDDLIPPTKFERQMEVCVQAPADVSAVYSPFRRFYMDDGKITWEGPLIAPDMAGRSDLMCLVGRVRPLHGAGLARRSVLDQVGGYDEALRFWECEEVAYRVAKAGRMLAVPSSEPFYLWRMHRDKIYVGGDEARYRTTPVALSWIDLMLKATEYRPLAALGLSTADRHDVLAESTVWARLLYAQDRTAFHRYLDQARRLDPDIAPTFPAYAAAASRYFGYEAAEGIAQLGRKPRSLVRKSLQKMGLRPQNSFLDWG